MSLIKCYFDLPGCKSALFALFALRRPCLGKKKQNVLEKSSLCLLHLSISILAAPATAVTVCIFDIWSDRKRKGTGAAYQCHFFHSPRATQEKGGLKKKKQTAVNKVVIVSHCDIWRCNFLRELCCQAFPAVGRIQSKRPRRRTISNTWECL